MAAVNGEGRALGFVCAPVLFQRVAAMCADVPSDIAAHEATKSTKVYILIVRQRIFYGIHECFNCCKNGCLVNTGFLCNLVYNICFSHFSLKKILLLGFC